MGPSRHRDPVTIPSSGHRSFHRLRIENTCNLPEGKVKPAHPHSDLGVCSSCAAWPGLGRTPECDCSSEQIPLGSQVRLGPANWTPCTMLAVLDAGTESKGVQTQTLVKPKLQPRAGGSPAAEWPTGRTGAMPVPPVQCQRISFGRAAVAGRPRCSPRGCPRQPTQSPDC